MSKETLVIKCPFCDQSDYEELENGKYKCLYCETPFYLVDDKTTMDLREAHNAHHLYKFSEAELRYFNILKETTDEKVKIMCNYGRLLAYFGVIFIRDIKNNFITTISNYHKDIKSIKDTSLYKEIISSKYALEYIPLLEKIDEEYNHLHNELAKDSEYDVFICCKVTPFNYKSVNDRTNDHLVARKLREELGEKYKVFYSDVDLTGVDYDAQIYSALMRSKILLVISSNKDYLESPWVQSEWRRWLNFIHEDKKGKQTLVLYELEGLQTPQVFSKVNGLNDESKVIDRIESVLFKLKEKEIKKAIDESSFYLKRGKTEEAYNILDDLTKRINDDYRPWTELIEWLEYTGVNQDDIRYKKFLNEALNRADEKDKNKILKDYGYLLDVKKEEVREDKSIIENKLNEAKTKVIFKKYQEAENIYMELCEKHIDYRPWYGLFELLVIQNIDKKDDRYKIYFEQALSLCNDKDKKEEIEKEYNDLFSKPETKVDVKPEIKENQSEVKKVLDKELDDSVKRVVDNADNIIGNDYFNENYNAYDLQANSKGTGYVVCDGENETAKEIIIPEKFNDLPVVAVDKEAFYMNKNIERVVLPDSITQIKESAFLGCSNLKEIVLPAKLTTISDSAFSGCFNLEKIILPNKLKKIGVAAFKDCHKITNIVFPNTLKEIHKSAFNSCKGLNEVIIPKGVSLIDGGAFAGCTNLERITVDLENMSYCSDYNGVLYNYDKTELIQYPSGNQSVNHIIEKSVNKIGSFAFYNCINLETIQFSNNINSIDVFAFHGCSKLKNIDIPSGLTILKGQAFGKCNSLTDLFIPGNIKTLEWGVFEGCDSLTNVVIENGVEVIGPYVFRNCKKLENVSIPSSVLKIDWQCFDNCINLKEIFIPLSVTTIGKEAFRFCSNLTIHCERDKYVNTWDIAWNISNRPVVWKASKLVNYDAKREQLNNKTDDKKSGEKMQSELGSLSNKTLSETDALKKNIAEINYSKGLKFEYKAETINGWVVTCGKCTSSNIIIPSEYSDPNVMNGARQKVKIIGENAFSNSLKLESITIPSTITHIKKGAFEYCTNLKKVSYEGTIESWCNITFESSSSNPMKFADHFYMLNSKNNWSELKKIDIPKSITKIGNYQFLNLNYVSSITIPNSITSIGDSAFQGCNMLTNITIPNSVKSIGNGAFTSCWDLTNVSIPEGVEKIGDHVFFCCDNLKSVVIPKSIKHIGKDIFYGCNNVTICFRGSKKNMKQFINVVKPSLFKNKVVFDYID